MHSPSIPPHITLELPFQQGEYISRRQQLLQTPSKDPRRTDDFSEPKDSLQSLNELQSQIQRLSVQTICATLTVSLGESEWMIWGSQDVVSTPFPDELISLAAPMTKHLVILDMGLANDHRDGIQIIDSRPDEIVNGHIILLVVVLSRNNRRADTFLIDPLEGHQHMQTAQDIINSWLPDTAKIRHFTGLDVAQQNDETACGLYVLQHARMLLYAILATYFVNITRKTGRGHDQGDSLRHPFWVSLYRGEYSSTLSTVRVTNLLSCTTPIGTRMD
jgi:hypothetical protein